MAAPHHQPIGLIAGQGALPRLVATGMRAQDRHVCCVGLRNQVDDALPDLCDEFRTLGMLQVGRWIKTLRRWGVREAVMVGGVRKAAMHTDNVLWRSIRGALGGMPDLRTINLWYRRLRHDRRNATVLRVLADELQASGITLIDSTTYIPDHLATAGQITTTAPTAQQQRDIDFAWPLFRRAVDLHIGQSLAVRNGDIIAVEAVEGTAAMITRAGELCRTPGWVLLKTAAEDHDMRADVPTIGVQTIEQLRAAGAGCIAVGAGRVILIDKPQVIAAADAAGLAIIGVDE